MNSFRLCRTLLTLVFVVWGLIGCSAENTVFGSQNNPSNPGDTTNPDDTTGPDSETDTTIPAGECDLSGTWAVRVWTINQAFSLAACSNNWYYYEIEDSGDTFAVTRGASCAFEVYGSANVFVTEAGEKGLLRYSEPSLIASDNSVPDDVNNSLVGRSGVFRPDGNGGCEFSLDKWWTVRGADLHQYLPPKSEYGSATIQSTNASMPLPTKEDPTGQQDWDNDGKPALTLEITAPVPDGIRRVVQRDWNAVVDPVPIRGNLNAFEVPMTFNNSESILYANSAIINQTSLAATPGEKLTHNMKWVKLDSTMPTADAGIDAMYQYCLDNVRAPLMTRSQDITGTDAQCCALPEDVDNESVPYPDACLFPSSLN